MSNTADFTDDARISTAARIGVGAVSGALAGVVMTTVMLLLASLFGIATPLTLVGDRISALMDVEDFRALMGRVGDYNRMKQLGVASVIVGQIVVGMIGGVGYAIAATRLSRAARRWFRIGLFLALPTAAVTAALWPVLGTHQFGLPIPTASTATILGLLVAFVAFERTLAICAHGMTARSQAMPATAEFTPPIARRALILGGLGLLVAGGGAALLRKLFDVATFSYDGRQYGGAGVQAITPNEQFYCVTKNVVDPMVNESLWRLDVTGMVETAQRYDIMQLKEFGAITQETTLMCISNGIEAGLISNAVWRGVPMRTLLEAVGPLPSGAKVRLHGVDNYTDTIPLEKAFDPTTLVVYEMNGEPLPHRHGFPARAIVPGYFGEKHVKWITRIEVAGADAVGFYEKQGWGPNFIVPIRSRIDQPYHEEWFSLGQVAGGPIVVKGIGFGGDRGVSRVEVSFDDGANWSDAKLDYPGTRLTWALWSHEWHPAREGDYVLTARATNNDGAVQKWDEHRPFKSGATGLHKITVHVSA